jgi:RecA/RadA recombinase
MADYDFHELAPPDLELLARDLLQAQFEILIESFKGGRDGGIDLRYGIAGDALIVQVKHMPKSGLTGLLRELKKETAKVRALAPARYMLVTSVALSAHNKSEIVDIVGRQWLAAEDVLGREDLNNLLERHETIQQQHFKLWLTSRAVLDRVLHGDIHTQTEFHVAQVRGSIRKYVPSKALDEALSILDRDRLVIVSGPPGVGKTTLANLILYHHMAAGWRPVVMRSVTDGLKLMQPGQPQIFYFDDFMGATFLGERGSARGRPVDQALVDFIGMVAETPNARLVLTTREHIFGQALAASERLRHSGISDQKVLLTLKNYTLRERGLILYNHLYFSELPDDYKDVLLADDFFLSIVNHHKFNPRLIDWLSNFRRLRNVPVGLYRAFIDNLLADPSEIWRHAYEEEIGEAGRSLLLALFSLGGDADGDILHKAFNVLQRARSERYGFGLHADDFPRAVRELSNAFIQPVGAKRFAVLDPSVLDLLNAVTREAPDNAVALILGSIEFGQIERVWALSAAIGGGAILKALRADQAAIAPIIGKRLAGKGRLKQVGEHAYFTAFNEDTRLTALLKLMDLVDGSAFQALLEERVMAVGAVIDRGGRFDVSDGAEAVRALEACHHPVPTAKQLLPRLEDALVEQVGADPDFYEVVELVQLFDLEAPEAVKRRAILQDAGAKTLLGFRDIVSDCDDFDQLKVVEEGLDFFDQYLGLDVIRPRIALEDALMEYPDTSDHQHEVVGRRAGHTPLGNQNDVAGLRDLFGSLRGDR